jgi:hypothetical protein
MADYRSSPIVWFGIGVDLDTEPAPIPECEGNPEETTLVAQ